jgi:DNA-binding GntR family transcriptional regulator
MRARQKLVPDRVGAASRPVRSTLGLGRNLRGAQIRRRCQAQRHGRTPVHEQIAKMYGQTTEYAQMEIFARGMPIDIAKSLGVKAGSPALTVVRRYYGLREELFEVTITTHPEGRYTYTMDMQRSLRPRL